MSCWCRQVGRQASTHLVERFLGWPGSEPSSPSAVGCKHKGAKQGWCRQGSASSITGKHPAARLALATLLRHWLTSCACPQHCTTPTAAAAARRPAGAAEPTHLRQGAVAPVRGTRPAPGAGHHVVAASLHQPVQRILTQRLCVRAGGSLQAEARSTQQAQLMHHALPEVMLPTAQQPSLRGQALPTSSRPGAPVRPPPLPTAAPPCPPAAAR